MQITDFYQSVFENALSRVPKQIEARLQHVRDKMGDRLDAVAQEDATVKNLDDLLDKIASVDPTPKGQLIPWVARLIAKNPNINKPEDLPRLKKDLVKFFKHRQQIENKDLNSYKTFNAVYDAIAPFGNRRSKKDLEKSRIAKLGSQIETVYNGKEGWVRIPHTQAASCYLGKGTRWCTAGRNHNMFDYYNDRDKLFVIFDKASGQRTQLHIESGSNMDAADTPVGFENVPEWAKPKVIDWYKSNQSDSTSLAHATRLVQLGADADDVASEHSDLFDLMKQYGV